MPHDLTHASFFSGVGGLDLGLERAGWRTVSFSEIDPYASAVLAERWPGVPNLGDITALADSNQRGLRRSVHHGGGERQADAGSESDERSADVRLPAWADATLWTGGFPCQDLSVAGKRAGFAGERSSLAFAFLDLVEQHRPPAILLENVPGLLSSNGGRDFGRLLAEVGNLGYWWAYRILDAQFFGVPQRRRRVFILALHPSAGFGPDSAAQVLSVGASCGGHSAASKSSGSPVADRFADGIGAAGPLPQAVTAKWYRGSSGPAGDEHHNMVVSTSPDSSGVREADGLAGRLDDCLGVEAFSQNQRGEVVTTPYAHQLTAGGGKPGEGYPAVHVFRKSARVNADPDSPESWVDDGIANTLNNFDIGDVRTTHAIVGGVRGADTEADLLPLGLDSHRYRCCGNGVVSNVSEWIGVRLAQVVALEDAA